jgi:hypothetical protein
MSTTPLRILCFGASLVQGHTAYGTKYTPYSIWLSQILKDRYPQRSIEVVTDGKSGEMVTGEGYRGRMSTQCEYLLIRTFELSFFLSGQGGWDG